MNANVQKALAYHQRVFETIEAIMAEWINQEKGVSLPTMMGAIGAKLKLDPSLVPGLELIIRSYVRTHSDYYIERGMKGGVQWKTMRDAREKVQAEEAEVKRLRNEEIAEGLRDKGETV
jgi:hypothetical protein